MFKLKSNLLKSLVSTTLVILSSLSIGHAQNMQQPTDTDKTNYDSILNDPSTNSLDDPTNSEYDAIQQQDITTSPSEPNTPSNSIINSTINSAPDPIELDPDMNTDLNKDQSTSNISVTPATAPIVPVPKPTTGTTTVCTPTSTSTSTSNTNTPVPTNVSNTSTTKQQATVLKDDAITTHEDTSIILKNSQLLANDSAGHREKLTITSIKPPRNGMASLKGKYIIYSPNSNFHGVDTITYIVTDSKNKTHEGKVNITVIAENDAPDTAPILDQELKPGDTEMLKAGKYFDDEEGSKMDYSATGLPPGLSIDKNGVITGKIDPKDSGEYKVTVTGVDAQGASANIEFSYVIVTKATADNEIYTDSDTNTNITDTTTVDIPNDATGVTDPVKTKLK
ncbi:MAG: cadherin-like domain-containing protein [Gammaproteobacteria bacterium]|nr:cadherin-like domain-containing protein [Gammaproteobacteria bacterium]